MVAAARPCWASRARLLREAEALALVRDPNVVGFVDGGVDGGMAWRAMEYLTAAPLSLRQRTSDELAHIGRQIGAVHDAGLVHRDAMPHDILVGPSGHAWPIGFGLPRVVGGPGCGDSFTDLRLSSDDGTHGSRRFMAPEQCHDGSVDAAADQYSLCAALLTVAPADDSPAGDEFAAVRQVLGRGREELPARSDPDMRAFVAALRRCGAR